MSMFLGSIFDGENDAHSLRSQFSVLLCEKVANAYSDEVVETNMLHYFFRNSAGSPPRNLKLDAK